MRICFWHSDLLLLGQGLRLLAICRFACGSLTSRRCRMSELARAAILFMAAPRHRRVSGRFRRQRVANKVLSKPAVSERLDIWKNMWHGRAGLM